MGLLSRRVSAEPAFGVSLALTLKYRLTWDRYIQAQPESGQVAG
jgi:hypothetical protein